jgi:hypothetical protein
MFTGFRPPCNDVSLRVFNVHHAVACCIPYATAHQTVCFANTLAGHRVEVDLSLRQRVRIEKAQPPRRNLRETRADRE